MGQNFPHTLSATWQEHLERLEGAYAPSTIRSYYADLQVFVDWCAAKDVIAFPASVETVCRFLEEQGDIRVPSTVRRRLYAIRKVHRLMRLPDPTHDEEINLAFRRVKRRNPVRQKQAKGLNRPLLDKLLRNEQDTPWGLRNRAMLSLGYELLTRR